MRGLALLATLCGCDALLHLDDIHAMMPPDAPSCPTTLVISDNFMDLSNGVCGSWGTIDTNGTPGELQRLPGMLVIAPLTGLSDYEDCKTRDLLPFGDSGTFVTVSQAAINQGYGTLHVDPIDASFHALPQSMSITFASGSADFHDPSGTSYGSTGFSPTLTRWLRIAPVNNGTRLVAQTSSDGVTWNTPFGSRDVAVAVAYVTVEIGGGASQASTSDPGKTVFTSFNTCPQ